MKKRILSLIITLCMVVSLSTVFSASVMAETATPTLIKDKTLAALGDSITTGYGLPGYTHDPDPYAKDSFVEKVAAKNGFTAINEGFDYGITAEQLKLGLVVALGSSPRDSEMSKAIREASAISLTIGGNDLLGALIVSIGQKLGLDPTTLAPDVYKKKVMEIVAPVLLAPDPAAANPEVYAKIIAGIAALQTSLPKLAADFKENFDSIIYMIKQMNPHAMIVAQTIPNPYGKIPVVGPALDAGVKLFNDAINAGASQKTYYVADAYTLLGEATMPVFNATNPDTPLDPHPNVDGHNIIANEVDRFLAQAKPLPTMYVEVAWYGDGTEDIVKDIRPASLEIQLYNAGVAYGDPITITEDIGWEFLCTLPEEAIWTADILTTPAGYTKELKVADGITTIAYTHTHTWDKGVVTTEPTVDKEGVRTFTCTVCDKTRTEPIAKLPATPSQTPSTAPSQTPSAAASKPAEANAPAPAKPTATSPKTADNTNVLPFALLGIGSLAAITMILKKKAVNSNKK